MRHETPTILRKVLTRCALMLVAATAGPAMSAVAGGLVPQHSEDLRPTWTQASKGDAVTLEFVAFGRGFRLNLTRNQRLSALAAGSSLQLYRGSVEGVAGSWARISVHDGLPRGMVWDGRELFIVEAAPEAVNDGAAGTVMFKLSDAALERSVSLSGDTVEAPRDPATDYGALIGELRARTQALKAGVPTDGVEISILGDAAYLARFGSESQARDAILSRLNNVDGIFSEQLGVQLQVASVDIANELTSGMPESTDSSDLLAALSQVRSRTPRLSGTGLTHLFTGRELEGNTAGIAYTLALCSQRFGASLTMAHSNPTLDALITAHEIGHVFGAPHDGTEKCAATPQNEYIMSPILSTAATSFSQCSLDQINAVIDSYSCVEPLPPPAPATPPLPNTPVTPPAGDGGGGGSSGGGGTLDAVLLLLLLVLALRATARARKPPTSARAARGTACHP